MLLNLETLIGFVFLLVILEFIEISWQKGRTLKELLAYNYMTYEYSVLYYFFKHTSFIFLLFVIIYTNVYNVYTITIIVMKFADISFKLYIIDNIKKHGDKYIIELFNSQDFEITPVLRYSNMIIYPLFLYLGMSNI